MFFVEALGSLASNLKPLIKGKERVIRESLLAAEVLPRGSLSTIALDIGTLRFEMKEEPELDTWTGDCKSDALARCKLNRLIEAGVLIDIENAPDLVMGAPSATSLGSLVCRLDTSGSLDERHGGPSKLVNLNIHTAAMPAVPMGEVLLLGYTALNENEKLSAVGPSSEGAAGCRH